MCGPASTDPVMLLKGALASVLEKYLVVPASWSNITLSTTVDGSGMASTKYWLVVDSTVPLFKTVTDPVVTLCSLSEPIVGAACARLTRLIMMRERSVFFIVIFWLVQVEASTDRILHKDTPHRAL